MDMNMLSHPIVTVDLTTNSRFTDYWKPECLL